MFNDHKQEENPPAKVQDSTAAPAVVAASTAILSQGLWPAQLPRVGGYDRRWLWDGYLGAGMITLLTSQWKSGKTTLVSLLFARMAQGGQLAGLSVAPVRAAVFSEESREDWDERCRRLHLGEHVRFFCDLFEAKPTMVEWLGMIRAMLAMRHEHGIDLVVIDSLGTFLPTLNENTAGVMTQCLLPLRKLTAAGLSVLLLHHPRKGRSLAGQAARGSGALPSQVDISMEMGWYGALDEADRRRWLRSYSRQTATRRHLIMELSPAGDDYQAVEAAGGESATEVEQVLGMVLEDAFERLSQNQILEQWPEDFRKPNRGTISRVLKRGVEEKKICRQGTGRRDEPFRYWLPGREDDLYPGEGAGWEEIERWKQRCDKEWLESARLFGLGKEKTGVESSPMSTTTNARAAKESAQAVEGIEPSPTAPPSSAQTTAPPGESGPLPVSTESAPQTATAAAVQELPVQDALQPTQEADPAASACPPFRLAPIVPKPDGPAEQAAREARRRSRRWP